MSSSDPADITRTLEAIRLGDRKAADHLMPLVYDELRRLAASYLRRESTGHTLQPTALVHEVFMKLVDQTQVDWQGRTHFFAVGAQAMRRLLVDHARGKHRVKRGGHRHRVTLDEAMRWTLRCTRGLRLPEPTRRAHQCVAALKTTGPLASESRQRRTPA